MDRRRLPAGIQTFRRIREEGYYYVDKTAYALRIARSAGAHYFLSRPRRFGKSLFVDTLKELYEGSEPLFRGLAVHGVWDWSKRHPVVRLDFAGGNFKRPGALAESATAQIENIGRRAGIDAGSGSAPVRFHRLIETLHERTGERVVVLVDEYDKPILDARDEAGTPATEGRGTTLADNAQAKANRDDLRGLYGTLKACDAHVELTFITGVSKFSKVSLFSDLNFLTDLTLDLRCAAICGYTETDLDTVFAPELPGLDRDRIRAWYNGYNWRGEEKVYNPYGILQFFASREFKAYWFETATPRFLIDTLMERDFPAPDIETLRADDDLLSAFDVDTVATEALLFR
ncbi:MAG: AAA family ATPase, partial [Acidobacteriota bacterium]|nr:AAA family ATPase [Acidobacteriota bacterium]